MFFKNLISLSNPNMKKYTSKYLFQTGGVQHNGDNNNCTCRALANAMDWTIEQSTNYLKTFGRRKNTGMTLQALTPAYTLAGFKDAAAFGNTISGRRAKNLVDKQFKGTTLNNLLQHPKYSKGTHIVIVTRHAVCIKDGQPVDTDGSYINRNTRVVMTFSKEES